MENGRWSAPSYIKISGGSFGFQIGGQATDLVLVFTSKDGFKGLLNGKVKLGADAAVAAGPVGRNAQVATDVMLKSPVLAYSRSKGLFAGIALDGAVVSIDDSANQRVYGKEITAEDILYNGKARMNAAVAPFVRELDKDAAPRKRVTD
jgi:lipid-binding SYLF domain-containing protein